MAELREKLALDASFCEKYQLGEKLGEGAMGTVYAATQRSLGRRVALKFLSEGLARDEGCRRRFTAEARMAARLSHTHLVAVHDSDEAAGLPFIVFEFVPGKTLRRRMDEGPVPAREALELAAQICDGLQTAHAAGILHRDIKPENILLSTQGVPKIADFGIAKDLLLSRAATQPGAIVGTPLYLSPEQAEGVAATAASDIYSVGCVLFEMLTGRLPFEGDTFVGLLRAKMIERAPRADIVDPRIPSRVGALLAVALERDPALRYPSASAFGQALRKALLLPDLPAQARQSTAGEPGRIPSGATATVVRSPVGGRAASGRSPVVLAPPRASFPWVAVVWTAFAAIALALATLLLPDEGAQSPGGVDRLAWLSRHPGSGAGRSGATTRTLMLVKAPAAAPSMPTTVAGPAAGGGGGAAPEPPRSRGRREGETNLAWLSRDPESPAALRACLDSPADRTSIEIVLGPRQRQSAAVAALLARYKMELGQTSSAAALIRSALERSANGVLASPEIRETMETVSLWLGDATLLTEAATELPAGAAGIEPSLLGASAAIGAKQPRAALELYRGLVDSGYPEAGVHLGRAVAHWQVGDTFAASLDAKLYLERRGLERGRSVASFVLSMAARRMGARRLAAQVRSELAGLPLPPARLQSALAWEAELGEASRDEESDSADDLPTVVPAGPTRMGREEWAERGWAAAAFEPLAGGPELERVELGAELPGRLRAFLTRP